MKCFKNKDEFKIFISKVSNDWKIDEALIEKDFYLIFFLSELNKKIPGLLFKGGTCCSHAYHAIDRFSEDIDLTLDYEHFGRKNNKEANHIVFKTCDELGFKIINQEEIRNHSHGNLNCYRIEYPILFPSFAIKPYLQIELAFYQKAYPHEIKQVNSLIGDWLINSGNETIAAQYGLLPFEICVQKLERTFVDKVFAICDYYETKNYERNSRHIYDLYKICQIISLSDPIFPKLINDVRNDRAKNKNCYSAKDKYDINSTLEKIIDENFYKADYLNITIKLLIKPVDYETAIKVLKVIIDSKLFS